MQYKASGGSNDEDRNRWRAPVVFGMTAVATFFMVLSYLGSPESRSLARDHFWLSIIISAAIGAVAGGLAVLLHNGRKR